MKIISVKFDRDIETIELEPRWFLIPHEFVVTVHTEKSGVIRYNVDKGFEFDGRSGGPMVDWVAPNLGTQNEIKAWLLHDIMFHDLGVFDFDESNDILDFQLDENCNYGWFTLNSIYFVVCMAESAFGTPLEGEKSFGNIEKVEILYGDR